jgi:hypothetical protein
MKHETNKGEQQMKKLLIAGVLATALAFTVSASAALVPGVYDPGNTGCVEATFVKKTKTLHLEKNCPTSTNAAAGADITGVSGQTDRWSYADRRGDCCLTHGTSRGRHVPL